MWISASWDQRDPQAGVMWRLWVSAWGFCCNEPTSIPGIDLISVNGADLLFDAARALVFVINGRAWLLRLTRRFNKKYTLICGHIFAFYWMESHQGSIEVYLISLERRRCFRAHSNPRFDNFFVFPFFERFPSCLLAYLIFSSWNFDSYQRRSTEQLKW